MRQWGNSGKIDFLAHGSPVSNRSRGSAGEIALIVALSLAGWTLIGVVAYFLVHYLQ